MKSKIAQIALPLVIKSQSVLERIRLKLVGNNFFLATDQDIYYLYRLFLNRPPDAGGLHGYRKLINEHGVAIDHLTDMFLYSDELLERQEEREKPVPAELQDFTLYVRLNDRFIGAAIYYQKSYEPHVTQTVRELLQSGDTFLDIGANIGYFSMLAGSILKGSGKVIAFEPLVQNQELFKLSVEANEFQNVELYPYAVSESEKTFALERLARNSNTRIMNVDEAGLNYDQVTAVALDDFLPELPSLDLIKMDIEGAEPLALRGMRAHIEKHRPPIINEFCPGQIMRTSQTDPVAYLNLLVELGYAIKIITTDGRKSEAMAPQQIMDYFEKSAALTHIDLLAVPLN